MSFDEQLQRALDMFASRLREEVSHQVRVVGDELAAAAREDQAAAAARGDQAVAAALEEQAAAAALAAQAAATALAEQAAATALAEQAAAAALADKLAAESVSVTTGLVIGIRSLSSARSLSDVLDTLVSCAGREAARAGIVLVRGDRFVGWRLVGFDASGERGDSLDFSHDDAGVIAAAVRSGDVASAEPDGDDAPSFAQLPTGRSAVAMPLSISGQVVAVLYADAGQQAGTLNLEPLEILTRFASQRLEALTAIKAARSLTATVGAPAPEPGRSDESDEHAAARRYARLLVSEIKLYHESQVVEGRRERDLATRLGGEIARVRTLYEQRVPPEIRQSRDYVHEELIRTLADGDSSLLDMKT